MFHKWPFLWTWLGGLVHGTRVLVVENCVKPAWRVAASMTSRGEQLLIKMFYGFIGAPAAGAPHITGFQASGLCTVGSHSCVSNVLQNTLRCNLIIHSMESRQSGDFCFSPRSKPSCQSSLNVIGYCQVVVFFDTTCLVNYDHVSEQNVAD